MMGTPRGYGVPMAYLIGWIYLTESMTMTVTIPPDQNQTPEKERPE